MIKKIEVTEENIKNGVDFYFPIGVIPDNMGINLTNVDNIEVDYDLVDGNEQLHYLKINFK